MLELLKTLAQRNIIRPLDYQFARFIHTLCNDNLLALASAMASYQLGQGNICLALNSIKPNQLFDQNTEISQALIQAAGHEVQHWPKLLQQQSCVSDGSRVAPLVVDKQRLYLYRYWQHETHVALCLKKRPAIKVDHESASLILDRLFRRDYDFIYQQCRHLSNVTDIRDSLTKWLDIEDQNNLDWPSIEQYVQTAKTSNHLSALDKLIPITHCLNWQKIATALAATQSFSVISGGPGTGKTTTVIRLLALLVELGIQDKHIPDIRLVAPTGKAAARLTESIGKALGQLAANQQVKDLIPTNAETLHRLLGVMHDNHKFCHNANNKLHLDILVVDEASMIDLPMMHHLLAALPDKSRLILLGDRDQLASVEAGSVLGDICVAAGGGYTYPQIKIMEKMTRYKLDDYGNKNANPFNNSLCILQKSYRFDARSGIGHLANAINTGNQKAIKRTLKQGFEDITIHSADGKGYQQLITLCKNEYQHYLTLIQNGIPAEQSETDWQKKIINGFHRFQLLCALREGQFGVSGLNEAIQLALIKAGLIEDSGLWYQGRPVLITKNDRTLGLFNGDIGIILKNNDHKLRAIFEHSDGTIKKFLPSRLPEHETMFAMTIHKSQGSEFEHTAIALPNQFSPMITRELVYTGITRAKKTLDIFCGDTMLERAAANPTERVSGLKERWC